MTYAIYARSIIASDTPIRQVLGPVETSLGVGEACADHMASRAYAVCRYAAALAGAANGKRTDVKGSKASKVSRKTI